MTTQPDAEEESPVEAGPVDLFGSSCACAPIAANKKVAIAKERATVKDSLSDEKREKLDELFDVLIENAFRFWKVDMACHSALRTGGLHGVRWNHERRRSALSEESQFLTFCVAWGRMVAEVRTQGGKILREKFDGSMAGNGSMPTAEAMPASYSPVQGHYKGRLQLTVAWAMACVKNAWEDRSGLSSVK
ncbi:MAG TPA: hypothetical protein VLA83_20715 [Candidatus Binatia bacterium]|nr:hypothetical protein [Candidatus Binatia bacterium]